MVLVRHIDQYLTKMGIEMGLDESVNYNISIKNGMVNVASDNATINANNTVSDGIDEELFSLIEKVRQSGSCMGKEEVENINNSLEVIKEELVKNSPRKSGIKLALGVLKGIKGSTEFMAAVAALVQFVSPMLQ